MQVLFFTENESIIDVAGEISDVVVKVVGTDSEVTKILKTTRDDMLLFFDVKLVTQKTTPILKHCAANDTIKLILVLAKDTTTMQLKKIQEKRPEFAGFITMPITKNIIEVIVNDFMVSMEKNIEIDDELSGDNLEEDICDSIISVINAGSAPVEVEESDESSEDGGLEFDLPEEVEESVDDSLEEESSNEQENSEAGEPEIVLDVELEIPVAPAKKKAIKKPIVAEVAEEDIFFKEEDLVHVSGDDADVSPVKIKRHESVAKKKGVNEIELEIGDVSDLALEIESTVIMAQQNEDDDLLSFTLDESKPESVAQVEKKSIKKVENNHINKVTKKDHKQLKTSGNLEDISVMKKTGTVVMAVPNKKPKSVKPDTSFVDEMDGPLSVGMSKVKRNNDDLEITKMKVKKKVVGNKVKPPTEG